MTVCDSEGRQNLRNYIDSNMNAFDEVEILDDTNIFEGGYINSTFAIKLLTYIENKFEVEIPDDEIKLSNFSTINTMMLLVNSLKGRDYVEQS